MSSLISIALDLNQYHFQRIKRGIRVTGTWLFEDRTHAPCLVLTDANALPIPGTVTPIVIRMRDAWKYAVSKDAGGDTIGDPVHVGTSINEWLAKGLLPGNPYNPKDHFAILDAINDNIRDLYAMPPRRPTTRRVVGEITTTNRDTGETKTTEVANHV
jgi:hypothetical protein